MTASTIYAYLPEDFGGSLPSDPIAAAQTVAGLPLTLARSAVPVQVLLDGDRLAAPVTMGGQAFATGDLAQRIWTLADVAKGIRLTGYVLRTSQPPGPTQQVIGAALPLKPGQRYQLSLSHGGGRDTPGFAGGLAAGTRILTEVGKRPIEDIAVGDKVWTDGHGFQPVVWHGVHSVLARGQAAPVRLRRGFMGLGDDLLIAGTQCVRLDRPEGPVLVPAAAFVAAGQATRDFGASITWHQLLLRDHAVIFAQALACESFWPRESLALGPPADWPAGIALPDSPAHPRLTEAEAVRLIG
ncbi:Hint domain-containing protein [Roseicyclus mahoneyensis]|nr:Hint domain-containing protein [Roseicyclus mahoneyensis]